MSYIIDPNPDYYQSVFCCQRRGVRNVLTKEINLVINSGSRPRFYNCSVDRSTRDSKIVGQNKRRVQLADGLTDPVDATTCGLPREIGVSYRVC
jgi:hypothetical protein